MRITSMSTSTGDARRFGTRARGGAFDTSQRAELWIALEGRSVTPGEEGGAKWTVGGRVGLRRMGKNTAEENRV